VKLSLDYMSNRLTQLENTKELSRWLKNNMEPLKEIPRYLIPAYFDAIITGVYELLIQQVLTLMPR
jgi:glycogen debranching enzyme